MSNSAWFITRLALYDFLIMLGVDDKRAVQFRFGSSARLFMSTLIDLDALRLVKNNLFLLALFQI